MEQMGKLWFFSPNNFPYLSQIRDPKIADWNMLDCIVLSIYLLFLSIWHQVSVLSHLSLPVVRLYRLGQWNTNRSDILHFEVKFLKGICGYGSFLLALNMTCSVLCIWHILCCVYCCIHYFDYGIEYWWRIT